MAPHERLERTPLGTFSSKGRHTRSISLSIIPHYTKLLIVCGAVLMQKSFTMYKTIDINNIV